MAFYFSLVTKIKILFSLEMDCSQATSGFNLENGTCFHGLFEVLCCNRKQSLNNINGVNSDCGGYTIT